MTKLFIYGTLKQGFPNHHYFNNTQIGVAKFVCNAETRNKYPLVIDTTRANLPYLLNQRDVGYHVLGEIYDADDNMITWLHDFEEVGKLYDIIKIEVVTDTNKIETCLCYVKCGHTGKYLKLPHLECYTAELAKNFCEDDYYKVRKTES